MNAVLCLAIGVLFGSGAYLLLKHDLIRVVGGMVLISNAAILFIMSARLIRGQEPIYPIADPRQVDDPLVQAMALTAVVISFGVSALLLTLVYRVFMAHRSVDLDLLSEAEERESAEEEAANPPISTLPAGLGSMQGEV